MSPRQGPQLSCTQRPPQLTPREQKQTGFIFSFLRAPEPCPTFWKWTVRGPHHLAIGAGCSSLCCLPPLTMKSQGNAAFSTSTFPRQARNPCGGTCSGSGAYRHHSGQSYAQSCDSGRASNSLLWETQTLGAVLIPLLPQTPSSIFLSSARVSCRTGNKSITRRVKDNESNKEIPS